MNKVMVLAANSFREMVRERMTLVIAGGAVFLILLSLLLGELTIEEKERMLADFGLAAIELAATAVALFAGSYALAREIERQTCLMILARPVGRSEFLLGKWGGVMILISSLVFALSLILMVLLASAPLAGPVLLIGLVSLVKAAVLLSWALFAAVLMRPLLALLSGCAIYLLGHWLQDLEYFAAQSGEDFPREVVKVLRWVSPNFDLMNWKSHIFLVSPPASRDIIGAIAHGGAWIFLLLVAATALFRRKDIV